MKKNILFVCKYNRFRSRIAEAFLKKFSKRFNVRSAGLIKGNPVDKNQVKIAHGFGINIRGKTKGLNVNLLRWADIIIIVADDIPPTIFDKRDRIKIKQWKIKDAKVKDNEKIEKAIKNIKRKVEIFIDDVKKRI